MFRLIPTKVEKYFSEAIYYGGENVLLGESSARRKVAILGAFLCHGLYPDSRAKRSVHNFLSLTSRPTH